MFATALALALAQDTAAAPQVDLRDLYDVEAYHLSLEVDPETETLRGLVTTTATSLTPSLETFQLDLVDAMEVTMVTVDGLEVEFTHTGDRLTCGLPNPVPRGGRVAVGVEYSGSPQARDSFTGFHWARTADDRPWINTSCQGPGAHSWWPCKASAFHPEDKPDRLSVEITVPTGLTAVSNGRLLGELELGDDRTTFFWEHGYPLETYTVTLNVAPYVVVEQTLDLPEVGEVPFLYYVLPENEEKAAVQFAQVPELLRIYSEAFGPWPFPGSKFALVETNFWGMEHSTAIAYGSSYPLWCQIEGASDRYASRNRLYDYILVHEVAHEWWGNAVSASAWGDFWIHEGFGTYAEGVYVEKTLGRAAADAWFAEAGSRTLGPGRLYRGDGVDSGGAYGSLIYSKGARVLNTLRHYIDDDDAWWRALREFNLRYRYRNASTEDFRAVVEEITGRDWRAFFDQWVYGDGTPRLAGSVRVTDAGLEVEIENTGTGETLFDVPLDLVWKDAEEHSLRLWIAPGASTTTVELDARPQAVEVVHLDRLLGAHDVRVEDE